MKKFNNKQLADFSSKVEMLLNAGISTLECISLINEDNNDENSKAIYEKMIEALNEGDSFENALIRSEAFEDYYINLIAIGERSGNLDSTLRSLSSYYLNKDETKENIKLAVKYPLIMFALMLVVIATLAIKVLPIFSDVYANLGVSASNLSSSIMSLSKVIAIACLLISLIVIIVAVLIYYLNKNAKDKLQNILKKTPFIKDIYYYESISSFACGMWMMLSSGVDVNEALQMSIKTISNEEIKSNLEDCLVKVKEGENFEKLLASKNIFNKTEAKLLMIASKTGKTDEVMKKLYEDYNLKTYTLINNLVSLVEPILVTSFAILIGLILISVVLPLLGIMNTIL